MRRYIDLPELPIVLTARGDWLHGGQPLHPRVAILFAQNIQPQPDGRYAVVLGRARQVIEVEDTAFFVISMLTHPSSAAAPLQSVDLTLSDGRREALDPRTLMQSAARVLYCRVRRQQMSVPVRFATEQYHRLMLFADAVEDPGGPDGHRAQLRLGPRAFVVGDYAPAPFAATDA